LEVVRGRLLEKDMHLGFSLSVQLNIYYTA